MPDGAGQGRVVQHCGAGTNADRHHYPETGQFTQQDPIGLAGGLNLYGFADGDPVNFDDPFGLCPPCGSDAMAVLQRLGNMSTAMNQMIAAGAAVGVIGGAAGAVIGGSASASTTLGLHHAATHVSARVLTSQVAAATGGAVERLGRSEGWKVTVSSAGRDIVARIKNTGDFRVSIEGLSSLTRGGELSSDKALTHLKNANREDVIRLVRAARELLEARKR